MRLRIGESGDNGWRKDMGEDIWLKEMGKKGATG